MRKKLLIQILLGFLTVLTPLLVSSQPAGPGGSPDDADVPIDGGLSLLLAAGVAYGAKKGYDIQKRKKQVDGNEK